MSEWPSSCSYCFRKPESGQSSMARLWSRESNKHYCNRTHLPLKLAWAMTAQKAQGKHWVLWKFIVARNLLQATYMLLFQGLEVESSYVSLALISNDWVLLQRWCWTSSIIYAMFLQKKTVYAVAPRDKRCSLGTKDFDKEFLEEDWWG